MLKNNYHIPINTILLIAKNYLFQCARKSLDLILQVFLNKLQNTYYEQKLLAYTNETFEKFNKNWLRFENVL